MIMILLCTYQNLICNNYKGTGNWIFDCELKPAIRPLSIGLYYIGRSNKILYISHSFVQKYFGFIRIAIEYLRVVKDKKFVISYKYVK